LFPARTFHGQELVGTNYFVGQRKLPEGCGW
jgi:hypothetical protein